MCNAMIGWVRDSRGIVTHRTFKGDISNAVTQFVCGGHADADGLANTTPYVMEVYALLRYSPSSPFADETATTHRCEDDPTRTTSSGWNS